MHVRMRMMRNQHKRENYYMRSYEIIFMMIVYKREVTFTKVQLYFI